MSTMPAVGVKACEYEQLDNGLHLYRMNRASKEALDQHFAHLEQMLVSTPAAETLRIILDFRPAGFPPIAYAFQKARTMYSRLPRRAHLRFAFVHRPNVLTSVVQSLFQLQRVEDTARFFPAEKYDEAVTWLLQDTT